MCVPIIMYVCCTGIYFQEIKLPKHKQNVLDTNILFVFTSSHNVFFVGSERLCSFSKEDFVLLCLVGYCCGHLITNCLTETLLKDIVSLFVFHH